MIEYRKLEKGVVFMNKSIVVINEELEVAKKKSILDKEDEILLLDEENPYFSVKNKEKKLLIFSLWETIHYGMLKNNLLSIIKEKFPTFIGNVFEDIKGINEFPYETSYFLYIIGEKNREIYKESTKIKKGEKIDIDGIPCSPAYTYTNGNLTWDIAPTSSAMVSVATSPHPPPTQEITVQRQYYQHMIGNDQIVESPTMGRTMHEEIERRQREAVERERQRALEEAYQRERDLGRFRYEGDSE